MSLIPLIPLIGPIVSNVLDRVLPGEDKDLKLKKLEISEAITNSIAEQSKAVNQVNAEEAKHSNIFVAGWRPFVGWVCGIGLAFTVFKNIFDWVLIMNGLPPLPSIPSDDLITILYGLLGLAGLRTYEKVKNITK